MKDALEKVQHDYKKDVLGFGEYLCANHHGIWKEVKNDWEQGEQWFAKSKVKFDTKVTIRNSGNVNKTEIRKEK